MCAKWIGMGIFILNYDVMTSLLQNSLNLLIKHHMTWIPKTCVIILKSLFIRHVCWCNWGGGESGFASSLFPLTISTTFNLWPCNYEVSVVSGSFRISYSGPANKWAVSIFLFHLKRLSLNLRTQEIIFYSSPKHQSCYHYIDLQCIINVYRY